MKELLKTRFILLAAMAAMMLVLPAGCDKEDDPEDFLGSVTVNLVLKQGLGDIPLDNVNVSLVNIQDNTERKALTDVTGVASYEAIPAGNYNINVSQSREEGEYSLTGSLSNVVVVMQQNTSVNLEVDAVVPGADFVVKEVYYPGAADSYVSLFKDQFIEIFNNSSETLYADSLYLACIYLERPQTSQAPLAESHDITEFVYAEMIERVPGTGNDYAVEPGKSIVIALNAMNFKEDNPQAEKAVDNSGADFERYGVDWLEAQGRTANKWFDFDNPDVTNMTNIYMAEKHSLFLMDTYGPGIVIFRMDREFDESDVYNYQFTTPSGNPSEINLVKIPVESVIDGMEIMENSTLGDWKRLPDAIDASFTYLKADGNAFYSGLSTRRKVDAEASAKFGRVVLQDTNNSSSDFETITTPDPRGYDNL